MEKNKFVRIPPELLEKTFALPLAQREMIIENIKRQMHEEKKHILQQAFEQGVLSEEEYEQQYQDRFYGNHGTDSFIDYLNAVMNTKADCFITDNERLLHIRERLEKQFGLKIATFPEIEEKKSKHSPFSIGKKER